MTNTSTFRARRNEYVCVGRCNRTAYTIYPSSERLVVVRSPYRTVYSRRVLFFRTSSDYRINFERVFLVVFFFSSLSFSLSVCLYLISYKDDDHPIDHTPVDRGTFFLLLLEIVRKPWEWTNWWSRFWPCVSVPTCSQENDDASFICSTKPYLETCCEYLRNRKKEKKKEKWFIKLNRKKINGV